MRTTNSNWQVVLLGCMAMMVSVFAPVAEQTFAVAVETEGKIIEIAPTSNDDLPTVRDETVIEDLEDQPAGEQETRFWIGIRGRNVDDPVLRTQFQLAADMGVVVEEVLPESPAAAAGLRKHDILLRANGEPLHSMQELSELVISGNGKTIEILLLRLGKEETIAIVPQQMPASLATANNNRGFGPRGNDVFQDLFQGDGNIIRMLPNGGFGFNGQMQLNRNLPNGYSVSITRQNNGPAEITVKQGDQTWTVVGDDEEALNELPEEIRERVRAMVNSPMVNFGDLPNWNRDFRFQIPNQFMNPRALEQGIEFGDEQRDKVLQRMEELEQRLQEMQRKLDENQNR